MDFEEVDGEFIAARGEGFGALALFGGEFAADVVEHAVDDGDGAFDGFAVDAFHFEDGMIDGALDAGALFWGEAEALVEGAHGVFVPGLGVEALAHLFASEAGTEEAAAEGADDDEGEEGGEDAEVGGGIHRPVKISATAVSRWGRKVGVVGRLERSRRAQRSMRAVAPARVQRAGVSQRRAVEGALGWAWRARTRAAKPGGRGGAGTGCWRAAAAHWSQRWWKLGIGEVNGGLGRGVGGGGGRGRRGL